MTLGICNSHFAVVQSDGKDEETFFFDESGRGIVQLIEAVKSRLSEGPAATVHFNDNEYVVKREGVSVTVTVVS